jgi:hypothetical protein
MAAAVFEYNADGRFRIKVGTAESEWASYRGIARLDVNGTSYVAVSPYFEGDLPVETVMVATAVPTTVEMPPHDAFFRAGRCTTCGVLIDTHPVPKGVDPADWKMSATKEDSRGAAFISYGGQ